MKEQITEIKFNTVLELFFRVNYIYGKFNKSKSVNFKTLDAAKNYINEFIMLSDRRTLLSIEKVEMKQLSEAI